ncbi:probable E3 ubiquitin-protein ligase HERC4 isoform X4 [Scylla paramamosain]|uniref:probable E3 ubiquitin-protein ligase HERC4 isoform X4 n=1 Tax=Scylla paramamosain TaxID=85552 RepID=UPI0030830BAF
MCPCASPHAPLAALGSVGTSVHARVPKLIDELQNYSIVQVAAGDQHSLALTSWGLIYARGDNGYGQLGVNSCDSHTATRKLVKSLARKVTVQLACGANHTLALTADGDKIPSASWHLDTDRGPRRTLPW